MTIFTKITALALSMFVLAACTAISYSPTELRTSGSSFAIHRSVEAQRDYPQLVNMLQKKANQCLSGSIQWVSYGSAPVPLSGEDIYKPTVLVKGKSTELHLQYRQKGAIDSIFGTPPDGIYVVVADIKDAGKGRVTADLYGASDRYDDALDQIEGWIRGTSDLCPNLR